MRSLLLVALMVVPLAGCIAEDPAPVTVQSTVPSAEQVRSRVQAILSGLPCEAEVGGVTDSSANLAQLSAISLVPEESGTIHAELDIGGQYGVHARYGASGFELYDLSDPLAPVHVTTWMHLDDAGEDMNDGALDVKFSPDNQTVLVAAGDGILLVDARYPQAMVVEGQWSPSDGAPVAGTLASYNPHMLATAHIAGEDWVFLAPNSNTGVWILRMAGEPGARTLEYVTSTLPVEGGPLGPHDMFVQKDELDGNWYLYSADGFHGWTVFNVNDPAAPMPAGGLVNPAELGYTHTMQAQLVGGKRIVATIAEVGVNWLRIYDATVLAAPILLAEWQAEPGTASTNPQHNMNIVDGKLYFAYYSFGMYVFDLEAVAAGPSLPLVGTATIAPVAHWAVGTEPSRGPLEFSGFWDVVLKDGIVYISHIEGGLIGLGYGCNAYDPVLTSTG